MDSSQCFPGGGGVEAAVNARHTVAAGVLGPVVLAHCVGWCCVMLTCGDIMARLSVVRDWLRFGVVMI